MWQTQCLSHLYKKDDNKAEFQDSFIPITWNWYLNSYKAYIREIVHLFFYLSYMKHHFNVLNQTLCLPLTLKPLGLCSNIPHPVWGLWKEVFFFLPLPEEHIKEVRLHTRKKEKIEREWECAMDLISWMFSLACWEMAHASSLHTTHSPLRNT